MWTRRLAYRGLVLTRLFLSSSFGSSHRSFGTTTALAIRPYSPPPNLRGLFVGSGSDGMQQMIIAQAIVQLAGAKKEEPIRVAYLGTATYDLPGPRQRQMQALEREGCTVQAVNVATQPLTPQGAALIDAAHVIVVSGGNTLFALDRWKHTGLDQKLRQSKERGTVLSGGSAGAICWFDGGHSDSADPETWKCAMLGQPTKGDESSAAPTSVSETKPWEYIRIQGLGFLPGLVCPHHDKTQSNGVLRATDFDQMLLKHPGEVGICIDHWAALQVRGDEYAVISIPDKEGSVLPNGEFSSERAGKAGIWIKTIENGKVSRRLCPAIGKLSEILSYADEIVLDPREEECRQQNPAIF